MKKTMWKWKVVITLLLCMVAVGGRWSVCKVQAANEDFRYVSDSAGTGIVITQYNGPGGNVDIPGQIDGKIVTGIGDTAFWYCASLESITIPASVENIGDSAFEQCDKLEILTPKDSAAEKYANRYNIKVKNPDTGNPTPQEPSTETPATPAPSTEEASTQTNVPEEKGTSLTAKKEKAKVKVTSGSAANPTVEYVASTNKSSKTVKVPDTVTIGGVSYKVTSVKDKAFKGNKKLTSVTVGKNVTSIGKDAFKGCANLKSVTINSTKLKTIGANAFSGNKKMTKLTLKTTKLTKKSVGKNALKGTNKKLTIKVPKKQLKKYKAYFKGKGNKSVKVTK